MKKNIVITILAVLVVGLGCFIVYDKVIDKNEKKDNNAIENNETADNEEEIEITEQTLNDLYTIAGIYDGDYTPFFELINVFINNSGKVSEYKDDVIKHLIYVNALKSKKLKTVTGDEYEFCAAGSGHCVGVAKEDYDSITKKYNISDKFEDIYENIYNNIGLYTYGASSSCGATITQRAYAINEGNNIVLMDAYVIFGEECNKEDNESGVLKFTFNKLSDGSYALYSVEKE